MGIDLAHTLSQRARVVAASSELRARGERLEVRCRSCGYGAVVVGDPPHCPMCRSRDWARHGDDSWRRPAA